MGALMIDSFERLMSAGMAWLQNACRFQATAQAAGRTLIPHPSGVERCRIVVVGAVDQIHADTEKILGTSVDHVDTLMGRHGMRSLKRRRLFRKHIVSPPQRLDHERTSPSVTGRVSETSIVKRKILRARIRFSAS